MWFPDELWRIIKNYQLGQEHWLRKFRKNVLVQLPKPHCFSYCVYSSAKRPIRFMKNIERTPFLKNPRESTVIYSIYVERRTEVPL